MKIESLLVSVEEKLSLYSSVPVIGIIPGVAWAGMGSIQCLSGIALTVIFSTATIFNSDYKSLRNRSFSHIIHGAANVVAGVIGGTPFLGSIVFIVRIIKSKVVTKKIGDIQVVESLSLLKPRECKNYVLVSPNHSLFLGYKELQNDDFTYYQEEQAYYKSLKSSVKEIHTIIPVSDKETREKEDLDGRFFDPPWGPVAFI